MSSDLVKAMLSALGLLLLAVIQGAAGPRDSDLWLGVFTPLPGARRLCSQSELGRSGASRVEIHFTLYATNRDAGDTVRFYAAAHGVSARPGQQTISVKHTDGNRVLSVHPVAEFYPGCGVQPAVDDRTVIVVSERVPQGRASRSHRPDGEASRAAAR